MRETSLFRAVERWLKAKHEYADSPEPTLLQNVVEAEVGIEKLYESIVRERWLRHHVTDPQTQL